MTDRPLHGVISCPFHNRPQPAFLLALPKREKSEPIALYQYYFLYSSIRIEETKERKRERERVRERERERQQNEGRTEEIKGVGHLEGSGESQGENTGLSEIL